MHSNICGFICILMLLLLLFIRTCISKNKAHKSLQHYIFFSVDNQTHLPREAMVFHENNMALYRKMNHKDDPEMNSSEKWKLYVYQWNETNGVLRFKGVDNTQWRRLKMISIPQEDHLPKGFYNKTSTQTFYMYKPLQTKLLCSSLINHTYTFRQILTINKQSIPIHALTIRSTTNGLLKHTSHSAWEPCRITCRNIQNMHKWNFHVCIYTTPLKSQPMILYLNTHTKQGRMQWVDNEKDNVVHVESIRIHTQPYQLTQPEA